MITNNRLILSQLCLRVHCRRGHVEWPEVVIMSYVLGREVCGDGDNGAASIGGGGWIWCSVSGKCLSISILAG